MLGKGIEEENNKNQTAEEADYLAESLSVEFDRISFSKEEKGRIYRRIRDTAKCQKQL